ncbi:MAG: F-type H+-transporting ATPase subunit b [Chlamydiales bacterium]|jgi:F-type H+-transporting ATPase subunit b
MMSNFAILALVAEGGFDPLDVSGAGNFLWTLVIFLVALPFMWKVVFGKIVEALAERDSKAADAVAAAERASQEAEKSRAAVEVALGESRAEAAQLLEAARERAEVRERDIVESAKRESEAMIDSARKTIRGEQEKALAAIRSEVVDLSLHAAGQVLGRQVNGEDDRRLATELVESLKVSGA